MGAMLLSPHEVVKGGVVNLATRDGARLEFCPFPPPPGAGVPFRPFQLAPSPCPFRASSSSSGHVAAVVGDGGGHTPLIPTARYQPPNTRSNQFTGGTAGDRPSGMQA